jgi:hypothetical protein
MVHCEHLRYVESSRGTRPSMDLTFKFFDDGKLVIIDNDTGNTMNPRELSGGSYDFYVRQRLNRIRRQLTEKIAKFA